MICYCCEKVHDCSLFKFAVRNEFSIDNCNHFIRSPAYKYKLIANNDALMKLIYDYFTGKIDRNVEDEDVWNAIARAIENL